MVSVGSGLLESREYIPHAFTTRCLHAIASIIHLSIASLTGDINCQPVWIYVF